jgi:hypothetical protein
MIFRDKNGKLVEININDYITDGEYYKKLMDLLKSA